jgi:hypothetical protein
MLADSGQDLGDAVWLALAVVAPRASSITVRGGVITVGSSLRPDGKSTMELRGKSALGGSGGLHLARILSESATPCLLTNLDIGSVASAARSNLVLVRNEQAPNRIAEAVLAGTMQLAKQAAKRWLLQSKA